MSTVDQGNLILDLLSEAKSTADADRRAIETRLSDIGSGVAGLRATSEAQAIQLAEMRAEHRQDMHQVTARLAEVERQSQAIPQVAKRVDELHGRVDTLSEVGNRRHQEIDRRVRALEDNGIEVGVYRRGAAAFGAAFLRWAIPAACGGGVAWWLAHVAATG